MVNIGSTEKSSNSRIGRKMTKPMGGKMIKVKDFKLTGYITEKDFKKCHVHMVKPKEKCIQVLIEIVPIKGRKK